MKHTILTLLAVMLSFFTQGQTLVHFDLGLGKLNANPATNRTVTLQPMTPFAGNLLFFQSDTNGEFTFTNAAVGDYVGQIKGKGQAGPIDFTIHVESTNLGTIEATDITAVGNIQTYPQSGRSAWSIDAAEKRFLKATTTNALQVYTNTVSNPNGVVTAQPPAMFYNYRGALWVKTNNTFDNTGWDCISTNRP